MDSRGRSGSRESRARSKSRSKRKDPSQIVCWNCNKAGHIRRQCTAQKEAQKDEANVAEEIYDALLLTENSPTEDWAVDSGTSFHASGKAEIMESYIQEDSAELYQADGTTMKIAGRGDVKIKSSNGTMWKLCNVRHIPGLRRNLISVAQLDKDGFYTNFGGGRWKISKGAMTLARGMRSGTLYLNSNVLPEEKLVPEKKRVKFSQDEEGSDGEPAKLSPRTACLGMCTPCIPPRTACQKGRMSCKVWRMVFQKGRTPCAQSRTAFQKERTPCASTRSACEGKGTAFISARWRKKLKPDKAAWTKGNKSRQEETNTVNGVRKEADIDQTKVEVELQTSQVEETRASSTDSYVGVEASSSKQVPMQKSRHRIRYHSLLNYLIWTNEGNWDAQTRWGERDCMKNKAVALEGLKLCQASTALVT